MRAVPAMLALALALGLGSATAQQAAPVMDHAGHAMTATPQAVAPMVGMTPTMQMPADASPATRAYVEALNAMHGQMMIDFTGDPDADFALGMIPHHEAAIVMARIQLEHGKDPQLRKIAEDILATQAAEVRQMRDWLAAHGH